jgi:hypothetical protein
MASFLGPFSIPRANQALISSIRVLPSGCAIFYSMLNFFSCNPVSMALMVFYIGEYALTPWTDFDYI